MSTTFFARHAPPLAAATAQPRFEEIYDANFAFVWRSVRRLGVEEASVDDVVQDVFVVVHRKLAEFGGRSSLKTWIFAIALRVVRDHRRTAKRKRLGAEARDDDADLDALPSHGSAPDEGLLRAQAGRRLERLLERLDDDRREVFVLAELELMTVPEIAEITGANPNTVYSRLRVARREFELAVQRLLAQEKEATR